MGSPVFGLALGVLLSSKYLTLSCAKSSITLLVTYKKAEMTRMRQLCKHSLLKSKVFLNLYLKRETSFLSGWIFS